MKSQSVISGILGLVVVAVIGWLYFKLPGKDTAAHLKEIYPGMAKVQVADVMGLPNVGGGDASSPGTTVWTYHSGSVTFVDDKVAQISPADSK